MKWTAATLGFLLLATNAFWLYQALDTGITLTYRNQQLFELEQTRKQLMAVVPELARNQTKKEVIDAISKHNEDEPYEKSGCVWFDWMGLKFDRDGRLASVSPVWSFGHPDPCFPSIEP